MKSQAKDGCTRNCVTETQLLTLLAFLYTVQDVTCTPVGGHVGDQINRLVSQSHTNPLS